jgi:hypothetical protein
MRLLHNLVMAIIIIAVGVVSVVFLSHIDKKHEELKSSRKAAFDSLLVLEPVDITCIYCGQVNHTNMKWVRDSLK